MLRNSFPFFKNLCHEFFCLLQNLVFLKEGREIAINIQVIHNKFISSFAAIRTMHRPISKPRVSGFEVNIVRLADPPCFLSASTRLSPRTPMPQSRNSSRDWKLCAPNPHKRCWFFFKRGAAYFPSMLLTPPSTFVSRLFRLTHPHLNSTVSWDFALHP